MICLYMHLFDIQTFIYVSRIVSMHLVMSWMISRKRHARTWWEEDLRTSVKAEPFRTTEAWVFNRWNLRCPGGKPGSEILQNAGKLKENNPRYNIRIPLLFFFGERLNGVLKKTVFSWEERIPKFGFKMTFKMLISSSPVCLKEEVHMINEENPGCLYVWVKIYRGCHG